MGERELREAICDVGRRLHDRGFVAAWDGNISARLADRTFLCTPTMCSKGRLRPDELCVVDASGGQLHGPRGRTSEILLHVSIYRHRPDVQAVVHSHAPHATAFAVSGQPLPTGVLAEPEYFLGRVPTVPYTLPGTQMFADSVAPFLDGTCALLLANHGAVTFGPTLEHAWGYTEVLDAYCRVLLLAQALGTPNRLTDAQISELAELRRRGSYGN
ncbi:MAG TPA: class II aldolase/adducin family protein [Gemmataceae bacterium]|jgi:L-fuculose-phosphate aldolase|nr:class II aldolase/adducin family protein [Gemmataceae bacterium]